MSLTLQQRKALAAAAANRLAQEAERKACAEAREKQRQLPFLTRWVAQRQVQPTTARQVRSINRSET